MLLISSKICIFRKVTVDLVTLMEKTDATFRVAEILLFEGFTKGFLINEKLYQFFHEGY